MEDRTRSFRVGLLLVIAVSVLLVVVFVLGQRQSLFGRKLHLHAAFDNAAGLVVGTPVRLAGVEVGTVEKIAFDGDLDHKKVHVQLAVANEYAVHLRTDSTAQISSKGLLGDAVVDLSVGSSSAAPLRDGDAIRTVEGPSLAEVTQSAGAAIEDIRALTRTVKDRIDAVLTDQVAQDVGRTMHALAQVTTAVERGHGPAHTLLYDRKLARQLTQIGDQTQRATTELSQTVAGVQDDLAHGKGTVGALLKDPTLYEDVKMLVGNVRRNRILRGLIRYTVKHDGLKATPAVRTVDAPVQPARR